MLDIEIKTIPHRQQRYETPGDYWQDEKGHHIRVSQLKEPRFEFLIALHELVEQRLCLQRGIDEKAITKFDEQFEAERSAGKHSQEAEAGDDSRAPYRREHFTATNIERIVAGELGVDWNEYAEAVEALLGVRCA